MAAHGQQLKQAYEKKCRSMVKVKLTSHNICVTIESTRKKGTFQKAIDRVTSAEVETKCRVFNTVYKIASVVAPSLICLLR